MARPASAITHDLRMWASRAVNRSLAPPDWLTVNLTLRCNLSCTMCTTCYDSPELSTREVLDLIDQAADWGVKVFNPLGGEPFIRNDVEEILQHASRRDMHVTLTTNATLIRPERARKIAQIPPEKLHINISFDGPESVHDEVRGEGNFRRAMAGYRALREADEAAGNPKRKICCNSILHRKNVAVYANFVDYLEELGFDGVQVLNLFRNRDDDMVGGMWFDPASLPALNLAIEALLQRPIVLNAPQDLRLVPAYYRDGLRPLDAPCWAGWKELYINADGSAIMCDGKLDFLAGKFGSAREQTLRQLWASEALKSRRQTVKTCATPCIQNCYLRRNSDSLGSLVREGSSLLSRGLGVKPPLRSLAQTLTLEISDTPDEAEHPLFRRLFARSPLGASDLLANPDRLHELRDLRYLDFGRGFLGAVAAREVLENIAEAGVRYESISLRWRGEPLLHPELSAVLTVVCQHTERVVLETSGRMLGAAVQATLARFPMVQVWVPPAHSAAVVWAKKYGEKPVVYSGPVVSWEGRVTASLADVTLDKRVGDALKEPWRNILNRLQDDSAAWHPQKGLQTHFPA